MQKKTVAWLDYIHMQEKSQKHISRFICIFAKLLFFAGEHRGYVGPPNMKIYSGLFSRDVITKLYYPSPKFDSTLQNQFNPNYRCPLSFGRTAELVSYRHAVSDAPCLTILVT